MSSAVLVNLLYYCMVSGKTGICGTGCYRNSPGILPLLAMGGEYFGASFLADHCKLVAENVTASNIKGAGHWIVQENTQQVQTDLLNFFLPHTTM